MHKLKQKLKSQTGASITFALLLFLVCAVVGSAVLVAGTAAAGRMSKIAEMDQRYYAVNSAARFLIDTVSGERNTATIFKEENKNGGTPAYYYLNHEGSKTAIGDGLTIPQEAGYWIAQHPDTERDASSSPQLTLKTSLTDAPELAVEIKEALESDGTMKLLVQSMKNTANNNGQQYSLELSFNLTKSELVEKTDISTITTYKFTWYNQNIRVVGSQRWQDAD